MPDPNQQGRQPARLLTDKPYTPRYIMEKARGVIVPKYTVKLIGAQMELFSGSKYDCERVHHALENAYLEGVYVGEKRASGGGKIVLG